MEEKNTMEENIIQIAHTKLDKETFTKLATAYSMQRNIYDDVENSINSALKKHCVEALPMYMLADLNGAIMDEVLNVLGDEFAYWMYECDQDFDKYCQNIERKDGSHPDVHNFEEMWEFDHESDDQAA